MKLLFNLKHYALFNYLHKMFISTVKSHDSHGTCFEACMLLQFILLFTPYEYHAHSGIVKQV